MKLRVVGWAYYDDDWKQSEKSWAERYAIIDEIKKHGYLFSGWAHQQGYCCAPILNDGTICCYSQRSWGSIMAEAHGYTGRMDYAKFAFMVDPDDEVRPTKPIDEDAFQLELNLNERFELDVSQDIFTRAQNEDEIKLDDLPELRYVNEGDTLALRYGDKTAEYEVLDVNRKRDLTEDELFELELDMYDSDDKPRVKAAEEKFYSAKVVIIMKLQK